MRAPRCELVTNGDFPSAYRNNSGRNCRFKPRQRTASALIPFEAVTLQDRLILPYVGSHRSINIRVLSMYFYALGLYAALLAAGVGEDSVNAPETDVADEPAVQQSSIVQVQFRFRGRRNSTQSRTPDRSTKRTSFWSRLAGRTETGDDDGKTPPPPPAPPANDRIRLDLTFDPVGANSTSDAVAAANPLPSPYPPIKTKAARNMQTGDGS